MEKKQKDVCDDGDYDNGLIDSIACGKMFLVKKQFIPLHFINKFKEFRINASKPFQCLKELRAIIFSKKELQGTWRKVNDLSKLQTTTSSLTKKKVTSRSPLMPAHSIVDAASGASASGIIEEKEFGFNVQVFYHFKQPPRDKMSYTDFTKLTKKGRIRHTLPIKEYYEVSRVVLKLLDKFVEFQNLLTTMVAAFEDLYEFCTNPSNLTLEIMEYLAGYCGNVKIIERLFFKWDKEFEKMNIAKYMFEMEGTLLFVVSEFLLPLYGNPVVDFLNAYVLLNGKQLDMIQDLLVNNSISLLLNRMNTCLSVRLHETFSEIWTLPKFKELF